jgi:hypothetical protein
MPGLLAGMRMDSLRPFIMEKQIQIPEILKPSL